MDFDFFEHLDKHVTRLRFQPEVDSSHFRPTESSVKYRDEHGDLTTAGKCLRASYFRIVGGFEKVSNSAYSEWIFKIGKEVENIITEQAKEAGIWVDNSIRFYNKEYNISGEIDLLIAEPPTGVIVPCEVKSYSGYMAHRDILGNTKVKGKPKLDQMMQLLVYLWQFRDQFPYGRMVYFARDDIKRKTFKVAIHQEGKLMYPVIDGEVFRSFTINDMLARYKELEGYVQRKEVPPGDYELQYHDAKVIDFAKKGKIGKGVFEKINI